MKINSLHFFRYTSYYRKKCYLHITIINTNNATNNNNNRHVQIKPTNDEDRVDKYTKKEVLNILKLASNRHIEIEDIRKLRNQNVINVKLKK